jgi:hypothetical protein
LMVTSKGSKTTMHLGAVTLSTSLTLASRAWGSTTTC